MARMCNHDELTCTAASRRFVDLVEVLCRPSGHHTPLDEDGAATWRISDEHTVRGANWRCLELGQASKPLMTSALATVDQHLGDGRLEEPRHNSSCQARNWFIPASHRQSIQHVPRNRLKNPRRPCDKAAWIPTSFDDSPASRYASNCFLGTDRARGVISSSTASSKTRLSPLTQVSLPAKKQIYLHESIRSRDEH